MPGCGSGAPIIWLLKHASIMSERQESMHTQVHTCAMQAAKRCHPSIRTLNTCGHTLSCYCLPADCTGPGPAAPAYAANYNCPETPSGNDCSTSCLPGYGLTLDTSLQVTCSLGTWSKPDGVCFELGEQGQVFCCLQLCLQVSCTLYSYVCIRDICTQLCTADSWHVVSAVTCAAVQMVLYKVQMTGHLCALCTCSMLMNIRAALTSGSQGAVDTFHDTPDHTVVSAGIP